MLPQVNQGGSEQQVLPQEYGVAIEQQVFHQDNVDASVQQVQFTLASWGVREEVPTSEPLDHTNSGYANTPQVSFSE